MTEKIKEKAALLTRLFLRRIQVFFITARLDLLSWSFSWRFRLLHLLGDGVGLATTVRLLLLRHRLLMNLVIWRRGGEELNIGNAVQDDTGAPQTRRDLNCEQRQKNIPSVEIPTFTVHPDKYRVKH